MDKKYPLSSERKWLGCRAIGRKNSLQSSVKRANLPRDGNIRTHPCSLNGHPHSCWTCVLGVWDMKTMEPIRSVHGLKTCGQAQPKCWPTALAPFMCSRLFFSHASRALHAFQCHCEAPCFLKKAGRGGGSSHITFLPISWSASTLCASRSL